MSSSKRSPATYEPEQKLQLLKEVDASSFHAVSRQTGVPRSTLQGWAKQRKEIEAEVAALREAGELVEVNADDLVKDFDDISALARAELKRRLKSPALAQKIKTNDVRQIIKDAEEQKRIHSGQQSSTNEQTNLDIDQLAATIAGLAAGFDAARRAAERRDAPLEGNATEIEE